ncbi:MAG: GNAT family N-acetyltransferase [Oscillospiraceae bacterium]|nr:GNAT family N-acetyltransferase [Oscillospiraceae bacterium]
MTIRTYTPTDLDEMAQLFYDTVHSINAQDYTAEQLAVWATGTVNREKWNRSFLEHYSLVAVENGRIVGFVDMDASGYLDRLYIHKDHQRRGIATALCDQLEKMIRAVTFTTHASITAKPFFQKRGYEVVKKQQVLRQGIALTNYVMKKEKYDDSISA